MRRFLSSCLLSFILLGSAAAAAEIKGRVVGAADNPISGAVVLERQSGAKAETDAEGRFVIETATAGRVTLEVIHPDYYEREFELTAKALRKPVTLVLVPLVRQN